jgi:sugar lactone lactonase YvrE
MSILFKSILFFTGPQPGAEAGSRAKRERGRPMSEDLETLVDGLAFPECPRWHDGELWLSEKRGGRVVAVGPDGATRIVVEVPGGPSGLGWTPDGQLLVVDASNRRLLRLDGEELAVVADLARVTVGRCNDLVVDATGRAYVGHFGYDLLGGAAPAPASLVLVEAAGSARTVADDLAFPNGCVITPDGETLLVAESAASRVTSFAIASDGGLGDRQTFASLVDVVPDGIALDDEGALWVSDPIGCAVVRVLRSGEITHRVSTSPAGAFACELGGDDGRTLYVCLYTEAAVQVTEGAPATGAVVTMRVDVPAPGRAR